MIGLVWGQRWWWTVGIAPKVCIPWLKNDWEEESHKEKWIWHSEKAATNGKNYGVHRCWISQPGVVHFFNIAGAGSVKWWFIGHWIISHSWQCDDILVDLIIIMHCTRNKCTALNWKWNYFLSSMYECTCMWTENDWPWILNFFAPANLISFVVSLAIRPPSKLNGLDASLILCKKKWTIYPNYYYERLIKSESIRFRVMNSSDA